MKHKYIFVLFFIQLASLLVISLQFANVYPQTNNAAATGHTIWSEYPYISPHLVQNDTHYIYVTDWGNYTFIKGNVMLICNYIDRSGTVTALNSTFWIKASKTALIFPFNPVVVIANDTYFEFKKL
jgi:hypothetical protein